MLLNFKFVSRGLVMKTASEANSPPASLVICAASAILYSPPSTGGFTELLPCGAADSATYRGMVKAGRVGQGFGGADDNDVDNDNDVDDDDDDDDDDEEEEEEEQPINQPIIQSVCQAVNPSFRHWIIQYANPPSRTSILHYPQGIIYEIYVTTGIDHHHQSNF